MSSVDRITRVNEILKRELADLIERGGITPRESVLVSVTEVKVSSDLRQASVFISVFGGDDSVKKEIVRRLAKCRGDLQKKIAHDLVLKYTPVLSFKLDNRIESGDRVLSILEEMAEDEPK